MKQACKSKYFFEPYYTYFAYMSMVTASVSQCTGGLSSQVTVQQYLHQQKKINSSKALSNCKKPKMKALCSSFLDVSWKLFSLEARLNDLLAYCWP